MRLPVHLRRHRWRDEHGRPVPYINLWSGEPDDDWTIKWDPDVRHWGVYARAGGHGVGTPDFKRQEPRRQRVCMVQRRCQVCAGPAGPAALLVIGQLSVASVDVIDLGETQVVSEPWLCPPCAAFALDVCPGLIRRGRAGEIGLIRPTRTTAITSRCWVEGVLEERSRRLQPILWAKLAVHEFDVVERVPA